MAPLRSGAATPLDRLIYSLGGVAGLAAALSAGREKPLSTSAIYWWRYRGKIPAKEAARIAALTDGKFSAEDFMAFEPRRGRTVKVTQPKAKPMLPGIPDPLDCTTCLGSLAGRLSVLFVKIGEQHRPFCSYDCIPKAERRRAFWVAFDAQGKPSWGHP